MESLSIKLRYLNSVTTSVILYIPCKVLSNSWFATCFFDLVFVFIFIIYKAHFNTTKAVQSAIH